MTSAKKCYNIIYEISKQYKRVLRNAISYKEKRRKEIARRKKKRVLQAIVEEYIKTAEPVSSGAIMNLEGLEYSSATIRNEMAELEKWDI